MDAGERKILTSVKENGFRRNASAFRHPAAIAVAAAALGALLATNAVAFLRGMESPWLLGTVILSDIAVIAAGIFIAVREVLVAEQRSESSQARLDLIVESAMDAIIAVDERQSVVLFNRAAEQVFGIAKEMAIGTPLDRFIPQRFRGAHHGHVEAFGHTGVTSRRMGDVTTLWALRQDSGEEFPIEASISQTAEDGRRYFTVILRDITVRKQAEDALRASQRDLRELSARVLEAREEEKTRIARELHDELGQLLTALKMDLASMRERLPGELHATASEMSGLLDQTVAATRRISADLRPLMLDDLGLADAARWLAEDFSNRSSIACRMEVAGGDALESLSKSVSTAVYRAIQESLTNIARHAQAKSAWATLAVAGDEILFEMEDDGRGIAPEDLAKARSLGLKGMRERIAHLGGTFEIARAPRGGTRLRVRVPLRGMAGEEAA
jgi:two-component system sensor histidine kinase UhpB